MSVKKAIEIPVTDPGGSLPMRNPFTCLSCDGCGRRQSGKVTTGPDGLISTDTTVRCRTCGGTGIVWLDKHSAIASPQAKAYNTLLDSLRHVIAERNRFDAQADREGWRRARAERKLRYAYRWGTGLFVVIGLLLTAVILLLRLSIR